MASIQQIKVDISLKINYAFVSQINEPKAVSVLWRRGNRDIESKRGIIAVQNHQAPIDDIFKMKTSLEYDVQEQKFCNKLSILELIFADTKQSIGFVEFDLGIYTNKIKDQQTHEQILDLKSEKFPGCLIFIQVNISVLDQLPSTGSATQVIKAQQSFFNDIDNDSSLKVNFDPNHNNLELQKKELNEKQKQLAEQSLKLEQEKERLDFQKEQAETKQSNKDINIIQMTQRLLQPGQCKKILEEVKQSQKAFSDPVFPPEKESLINSKYANESKDPGNYENVQFVRPSGIKSLINKNGISELFEGQIEPNDILQGDLGNCYFLTSLACLAEYPDRIKKLFVDHQYNQQGIYGVYCLINGCKYEVVVDDHIPCRKWGDSMLPKFSRGNGPELWVIIMEKAWAKIHGSYDRIVSGVVYLTLRDLTGAPGFRIDRIQEETDLFGKLLDWDKKGYLMSSCIYNQSDTDMKKWGLLTGHAYSLIQAAEVKNNGKTIQLVKLRNPWGDHEWNGDWSDKSPLWTDQLKKEVGFDQVADDGIFWMSFQDFQSKYSDIDICKYQDDFQFNQVMLPYNKNNDYHFVKITFTQSGQQTLAVSQYSDRLLSKKAGYKYSIVRLILIKPGNDIQYPFLNCEFIKADQGTERDHYFEFDNLDAGDYYIYCDITWDESSSKLPKQEISLNCYGLGDVYFSQDLADNYQQIDVLKNIFISYKQQYENDEGKIWKNDFNWHGAPSIKEFSNQDTIAYFYFYLYENNEEGASLFVERDYPESFGSHFIVPKDSNLKHQVTEKGFKIEVGPGEKYAIIKRICPPYKSGRPTSSSKVEFSIEGLKKFAKSQKQQKIADGIFKYYTYQGFNYIMYYVNETSDKKYSQKFVIEDIKNLELQEKIEMSGKENNEFTIALGPGEDKLLFYKNNGEQPSKTFSSYSAKITDA